MKHATYYLKHHPEAREIGEALNTIAADIFCGVVLRAEDRHIQRLGHFVSDTIAGTARATVAQVICAAEDCNLLEFGQEGAPL